MLVPAGPPGWIVIGVLLAVDVVLVSVAVADISQNTATTPTTQKDLNVEMRGEYVPPGLNTGERNKYREAVERYKQDHHIPPNVNVPKSILDKIGKSIKQGKKPVDAADEAPEPPENLKRKGKPKPR